MWVSWTLADEGPPRLRSGETLADGRRARSRASPLDARLVNCSRPEAVDAALPDLLALGGPVGAYANAFPAVDALKHGGTVDVLGHRDDLVPERYAEFALGWAEAGAAIVGGCCEVGPEHIAALRDRLHAAGIATTARSLSSRYGLGMHDALPTARLLAVARGESRAGRRDRGRAGVRRVHARVARGRRRHRRRPLRRHRQLRGRRAHRRQRALAQRRASSMRTCTSSRASSASASWRACWSRAARPPSSAIRTSSPTRSAPDGRALVHRRLRGAAARRARRSLPSCVPASPFESPRAPLSLDDIAGILARERVLGLAEMMNFPAVIAGAPERAREDRAGRRQAHRRARAGRRRRGARRLPGHRHRERSRGDRRCAEALEKRRRGAWVLLREASNARNLRDLLPLVREYGPERCAFCTDDREPDFLLREGHIDQMCRVAVAEGISPEDALLLATLHPALCHGLPRVGAIAPGYRADCVLLDDLGSFRASLVLKDGRVVARDGVAAPFASAPAPDWVRDSVRIAPLPPTRSASPHASERVRAIGLIRDQILTRAPRAHAERARRRGRRRPRARPREDRGRRAPPRHRAASASASSAASACAAAPWRRPSRTTRTTSSPSAWTTTTCARCVERLAEIGGGIVIYEDGELRAELALPVAGLMSERAGRARWSRASTTCTPSCASSARRSRRRS